MRLSNLVLMLGFVVVAISVAVFGSGPSGDSVLDALWGKDITVRELPGGAPAGASEKMLNTKVTWSIGTGSTTVVAHYVGNGAVTGIVSTGAQSGPLSGAGLVLPLATALLGLATLVTAIRTPLRRTSNPI